MARDPNKRAFSREVDKTRKRTRAAITRLEKQAAESNNFLIKRRAKQQIVDLQKNLSLLSANKNKAYLEQAQAALQTLSIKKVASSRALKSEQINFQAELNAARRGEASILQAKGKERVQLFYKATQSIWQGVPMAERNAAIMEKLGVNSLQAAFTKVMNMPEVRDTYLKLDLTGDKVEDTDKMGEAYKQAERTQVRIDTPIEIVNLNIEKVKAYGSE